MKKIIIINGHPQSGKDTFVLLSKNHGRVQEYSSVSPIVEELKAQDSYDEAQKDHYRNLISEYKQKYIESLFKKTKETIDSFMNSDDSYLFIHIREPEEIARFKKLYPDLVTLLIVRKDPEAEYTNDSDKNVNNYDYDWVIHNDGNICDLDMKANLFLAQI